MIRQSSAGIYSWLPLGFKVMKKIEKIVREEQDKIGAQEILMPTIQSSEIWKESGRYDDYGEEMLRIKDRQNREMLYGPTNEEQVIPIILCSLFLMAEILCSVFSNPARLSSPNPEIFFVICNKSLAVTFLFEISNSSSFSLTLKGRPKSMIISIRSFLSISCICF